MSDLTDNKFYPFEERIWLCIRFAKWACDQLTEDVDFGQKIIFSDESHFDLGGYVNKRKLVSFCRVGYCTASRGSHLNEIIFHY